MRPRSRRVQDARTFILISGQWIVNEREKKMKVTVLAENTSVGELPSEHGLSLYLETQQANILFDAGQSDLFAMNAECLGVDLAAVDICVLSHGHYDHSGGLRAFMARNEMAPIYMSRYAAEPHVNAAQKEIGIDVTLADDPRVRLTEGVTVIGDGLTLYDCNDRRKKIKTNSYGLCRIDGGKRVEDDFRHEQYLLIEEHGKRVLISGCSHKGIVNIEEWFCPDVLIGGFHWMKEPVGETLYRYARMLDSYDTMYYTCHCTGEEQYRAVEPLMRRLQYLSTGMTIEI